MKDVSRPACCDSTLETTIEMNIPLKILHDFLFHPLLPILFVHSQLTQERIELLRIIPMGAQDGAFLLTISEFYNEKGVVHLPHQMAHMTDEQHQDMLRHNTSLRNRNPIFQASYPSVCRANVSDVRDYKGDRMEPVLWMHS